MKRTSLRPGQPPKRRVPVARVNRKRRARMYARNFGDHADTIRALPCYGCGASSPSDPAHAVGRKMGGCGGDKRVLWPTCRDNPATGRVSCHTLYDTDRAAFTKRTGLTREDVLREAARLWAARVTPGDQRKGAAG